MRYNYLFSLLLIFLFSFSLYGWKIYSSSIEGWNVPHECGEWKNLHCSHEREDAFRDKMCQYGNTVGGSYKETDVWATDFIEDRDFGGSDNIYFDSSKGEVGWHSGHGGLGGSLYYLPVIKKVNDKCGAWSNEMVLGENPGNYYASPYPGYQNWVFFDTCCSATLRVISSLWNSTGRGVHIIGGFNEVKADPIYWWIGWKCDSNAADWVREFVKDVYETGWSISHSFLENLKWETKACPVVVAFGTSSNNCYDRLYNEKFNNGYGDVTSGFIKCYTYWENCNGKENC